MFESYLKLTVAALLPVAAAILICLAEKKKRIVPDNLLRQVIIGIIFGGLAVVGNEWAIPVEGALANCRDAAVMTAGLMFGGPAGIIAGLIGGIERWLCVYWGGGMFTRFACSISTIIAGFFAALLRKVMMDNKCPDPVMSLCAGVVMEDFHLTMVFLTNMDTPERAIGVVMACAFPMIVFNGLSVMCASIALTVASGESLRVKKKKHKISQLIQWGLLITIVVAFVLTSSFVTSLQSTIAYNQIDSYLTMALDESASDLKDLMDEDVLWTTKKVSNDAFLMPLSDLLDKYEVSEVSYINEYGMITDSTNPDYIGFNMASGEQSAEFLCLLEGASYYIQDLRPITYDESKKMAYVGVIHGSGFIQVGYNEALFYDNVEYTIQDLTKNRHVGKTGYVLIYNSSGEAISSYKDLDAKTVEELYGYIPKDEHKICYEEAIDAYVMYKDVEGYDVMAVYPAKEAMSNKNTAVYVNFLVEILMFAAMFGCIYFMIHRIVVSQIHKVNTSLENITEGHLDEIVKADNSVEFTSLSDDINETVDVLKRYIDEAASRIDRELEFAKNIQSSALPSVFPAYPQRKEFDIFAGMTPAKEVGGDFYDFYFTGQNHFNTLIADVSGKGIPAAMFMMRAKAELKSLAEAGKPVNEVFTGGNAALCEGNDAEMFVTAWQADVDLSSGNVIFANAGHNPPLIKKADGQFEYIKGRAGFVLAGLDGFVYKPQELQFAPGDILFLYTDGVTEAENVNKELYGEERLQSILNSLDTDVPEEIFKAVRADISKFTAGADQSDDITILVFKYNGPQPADA